MRNRGTSPRLLALVCLVFAAGAALIAAGCGQVQMTRTPAPTLTTFATSTPAATRTPAATPTRAATATPMGATAQTLAAAGQQVYDTNCARCHGKQGEGVVGPSLFGTEVRLAHWGTAQALYDFAHTAMPADAPGTLTDPEYLQVVTFLLLKNGFVQPDTAIDKSQLAAIKLKPK